MTSSFSQDLLDKCQFKWQELAGKELLIKVGEDVDSHAKTVCVMGVDKTSGKCYVLHTGIEEN